MQVTYSLQTQCMMYVIPTHYTTVHMMQLYRCTHFPMHPSTTTLLPSEQMYPTPLPHMHPHPHPYCMYVRTLAGSSCDLSTSVSVPPESAAILLTRVRHTSSPMAMTWQLQKQGIYRFIPTAYHNSSTSL